MVAMRLSAGVVPPRLNLLTLTQPALQYWYFNAATQPTMIAATASSEPSASVESPVSPCPIVQPRAVTPPKPINTPPTIWLTRSSTEANPSQRNVRVASATPAEPTANPRTPAMPKVTILD